MSGCRLCCGFAFLLLSTYSCVVEAGIDVGTLPTLAHGVGGTLQFLSTSQLKLRGFSYDGAGPAAFVYYYPPGVTVDPNRNTAQGVKISLPSPIGDNTGAFTAGTRYNNQDLIIDLPAGTDICDIATFTIWCEQASVFFSMLEVPRSIFVDDGADPCRLASGPVPTTPTATHVTVGTLPTLAHGVGGTLVFLSASQLKLRGFTYDGAGPGTYVYYYPHGVAVDVNRNTAQGVKIPVPSPAGDSMGAFIVGRSFSGEDLTIDLPSGTDVCDISTFTIWCEEASVFFSRLEVPRSTFVDNGADPCRLAGGTGHVVEHSTRNCIPLHNSLQLYWTVDRNNSQVDFKICGCQSSEPNILQYMGFGISGSNSRTLMDGADVTIAWTDDSEGPRAVDYHLRSGNRVQCRTGLGVCPDALDDRGTCSNDVLNVHGTTTNRKQCVSFTRPFRTDDDDCDLPIVTNEQQYIVWGIGPVEETAFRHITRSGADTAAIHLGRDPVNQCEGMAITCEGCPAFEASVPRPRSGNVFHARIGPSGNDRGYMALTGQAGWGIAWYINGILAPEIYVVRGDTYTFIVEGGDDPDDPSNYHPFYITNSISGGRLQNTQQQQMDETVYAGFNEAGDETAIGRLCMLTEDDESASILERCGPMKMYIDSLSTDCASGSAGMLQWTPDATTPNTLYYQCATHRNLGWRIRVVNDSSQTPYMAGSAPSGMAALPLIVMLLATLLFTQ